MRIVWKKIQALLWKINLMEFVQMTNLLDSLGLNISVTEAGMGTTSDLTWLFLVLKTSPHRWVVY